MAYRGFAKPIIAKRIASSVGIEYSSGIRCGRAIKIEIDPVYQDVSEYDDINDIDEKKVFAYADITLNTGEFSLEAESMLLGREISDDTAISKDTDISREVGFGMQITESIQGIRRYIAIWLHRVCFWEDSGEHNTKNENMDYDTPVLKGVALPENDGTWRTKKVFKTSKDADSWLRKMAGME